MRGSRSSTVSRRSARRERRRADRRLGGRLVGQDESAFAAVCSSRIHYEDPLTPEPLEGIDAVPPTPDRLWAGFPDARLEQTGERLTNDRFVAAPCKLLGTHRGAARGPARHQPVRGRALHLLLRDPAQPAVARARLLRPVRRRHPARDPARAGTLGREGAADASRLRAAGRTRRLGLAHSELVRHADAGTGAWSESVPRSRTSAGVGREARARTPGPRCGRPHTRSRRARGRGC